LEYWNIGENEEPGIMECWNTEKRKRWEEWNIWKKERRGIKTGFCFLIPSSSYPSFHYSIIPVFHGLPLSDRSDL
jgi:hypothetical protein